MRQQSEQIFGLKEQVTGLQAEVKMKGSQYEERLQSERSRHKDALHDSEQIRQKEVYTVLYYQDNSQTQRNVKKNI